MIDARGIIPPMTTTKSERGKLLKRIRGFCSIMGDDLQGLDSELLTRIDETIRSLETPVHVVLAGLADSQHHALASTLVGAPLIETKGTIAKCPLLRVRMGSEPRTSTIVGDRSRTFRGCVIDKLVSVGATNPIEVELPTLPLSQLHLSILPTYEAQEDRAAYLLDLIGDSEIVVWCSNASTVWHPNERRLWFTVPDDLKARSILTLTHAQNLADDDSARTTCDEKREIVADDFAHIVTSEAADDISDLLDTLLKVMEGAETALLDNARTLRDELSAIPLGSIHATPIPIPAPTPAPSTQEADASSDPAASLRTTLARDARACIAATESMTNSDSAAVFEAMATLLSGLSKTLKGGLTLHRDHEALMAEISEADDLIGLLSYEGGALAVQEAADLLRQIAVDVLDRLDPELAMDGTNAHSDENELRKAS